MGEVIPFPIQAARVAVAVPTADEGAPSVRPSLLLLALSMLLLAVIVRR